MEGAEAARCAPVQAPQQQACGARAARCSPDTCTTPAWQIKPTPGACSPHPWPAAGAPEEASARRWLQVQGVAVKRIMSLEIVGDDITGLSALLASLPALSSVEGLRLRPDPGAAPRAAQACLAMAVCGLARCASLQHLDVDISLDDRQAGQLHAVLGRLLARVQRTLEGLILRVDAGQARVQMVPAIARLTHLVAGLAGLAQLRELDLRFEFGWREATLPACLSCLAQLTSLRLSGLNGLRCAPGWARLPALARLEFEECSFAADGEDALPGMGALASLTRLELWDCPSLRTLPAPLWALPQLRSLVHSVDGSTLDGLARDELPVAALPACAPSFACLTDLGLQGHNIGNFPAAVLTMRRLTHLNLARSYFSKLPEGVTVLTALETLHLGRHNTGPGICAIGGAIDARALGSLAGFPNLQRLYLFICSVLFCPSFLAAAAHPRLSSLLLFTSYPASGPSCLAFLGFVGSLLQQGRSGVLELVLSVVHGEGRQDSRNFRAALKAVGFPLTEDDLTDLG